MFSYFTQDNSKTQHQLKSLQEQLQPLQEWVATLQNQIIDEIEEHKLTRTKLNASIALKPVQALVFQKGAHRATKQNLEYLRCPYTYTLNAHATEIQTFKTTFDQKQAALTAELTVHSVTKAKLKKKKSSTRNYQISTLIKVIRATHF